MRAVVHKKQVFKEYSVSLKRNGLLVLNQKHGLYSFEYQYLATKSFELGNHMYFLYKSNTIHFPRRHQYVVYFHISTSNFDDYYHSYHQAISILAYAYHQLKSKH